MANPIRFNPGQALIRLGFEPSPGIPAPTRWHDVIIQGEKVAAESKFLEVKTLSRAAMRPAPLPSKLEPGGEVMFYAASPRQDWPLFLTLLAGYDVPGGPLETGAYKHKIHRLGASLVPETLALRIDRNDGRPWRYTQCRPSKLGVKFAASQLHEATISMIVGAQDPWGDVNLVTAGVGLVPYIRGINDFNYDFPSEAYFCKITAVTGTTVSAQFKRGAAASYGSVVGGIPRSNDGVDGWYWVPTEAGILMGDRGLPTTMLFPLPNGGTDFTVGDEFSFPAITADWSGTIDYPPSIVTNEIYSSISLAGGPPIEVDSGDISIDVPAAAKFNYGGRQPHRTRVRGLQAITGKISREYAPANLQRQLVQGTPFSIVIAMHSRVAIGTTGALDQSITITMPNCLAKGKTASAESETVMNEPIEFQPYPDPSNGTYPSDITVEIVNEIPNLLPGVVGGSDAFA